MKLYFLNSGKEANRKRVYVLLSVENLNSDVNKVKQVGTQASKPRKDSSPDLPSSLKPFSALTLFILQQIKSKCEETELKFKFTR